LNVILIGLAKVFHREKGAKVRLGRLGNKQLTGPVITCLLPELHVPCIVTSACAVGSCEYTKGAKEASKRPKVGGNSMAKNELKV
jgi:hypothetical protein